MDKNWRDEANITAEQFLDHGNIYYKDPVDELGGSMYPQYTYIKKGTNDFYNVYDQIPDMNANRPRPMIIGVEPGAVITNYPQDTYGDVIHRKALIDGDTLMSISLGVRYTVDVILKYFNHKYDRLVSIAIGSQKIYKVTYLTNGNLITFFGRPTRIVRLYEVEKDNTQAQILFDASYNYEQKTFVVDTINIRDISVAEEDFAKGDNQQPPIGGNSERYVSSAQPPRDITKIWIDISDINHIVARKFNMLTDKWDIIKIGSNDIPVKLSTKYFLCAKPPINTKMIWIDCSLPGLYNIYKYDNTFAKWMIVSFSDYVVIDSVPTDIPVFPTDTSKLYYHANKFYYYNFKDGAWEELLPHTVLDNKAYFIPDAFTVNYYQPTTNNVVWFKPKVGVEPNIDQKDSTLFYLEAYISQGTQGHMEWINREIWLDPVYAPGDIDKVWVRYMTPLEYMECKNPIAGLNYLPTVTQEDIDSINPNLRDSRFLCPCIYDKSMRQWVRLNNIDKPAVIVNSAQLSTYNTNLKTDITFNVETFDAMFKSIDCTLDKLDYGTITKSDTKPNTFIFHPLKEGTVTLTFSNKFRPASNVIITIIITKDGTVTVPKPIIPPEQPKKEEPAKPEVKPSIVTPPVVDKDQVGNVPPKVTPAKIENPTDTTPEQPKQTVDTHTPTVDTKPKTTVESNPQVKPAEAAPKKPEETPKPVTQEAPKVAPEPASAFRSMDVPGYWGQR